MATPTRAQLESMAKGDFKLLRALELLFSAPNDLTETNLRVTALESDMAAAQARIKRNEVLLWLSM